MWQKGRKERRKRKGGCHRNHTSRTMNSSITSHRSPKEFDLLSPRELSNSGLQFTALNKSFNERFWMGATTALPKKSFVLEAIVYSVPP